METLREAFGNPVSLVLLGGFIGWLLGLLSPRIIDEIRKPYTRRELRRTIFEELRELRARLALTAMGMALRGGTFDQAQIEWMKPIMKEYKGYYSDRPWQQTFEELSKMTDEQLKATGRMVQKPGHGLQLKKFRVPYLASHVSSLALFSDAFQRAALEILVRLDAINEETDAGWFYFNKTFDPAIDEDMHTTVLANVESAYQHVGRLCRDAADMTGNLLKLER